MNDLGTMIDRPTARGRDSAILCVDDEPEVLSALGRTLRSEPYEVFRARGGDEAPAGTEEPWNDMGGEGG